MGVTRSIGTHHYARSKRARNTPLRTRHSHASREAHEKGNYVEKHVARPRKQTNTSRKGKRRTYHYHYARLCQESQVVKSKPPSTFGHSDEHVKAITPLRRRKPPKTVTRARKHHAIRWRSADELPFPFPHTKRPA